MSLVPNPAFGSTRNLPKVEPTGEPLCHAAGAVPRSAQRKGGSDS